MGICGEKRGAFTNWNRVLGILYDNYNKEPSNGVWVNIEALTLVNFSEARLPTGTQS